jgi:uncharacterized spore protein YtfJ
MTDRPSSIERAAGRTVEGLDSVFGPASPAAVFSEPERLGDDLVITAASWERAGGFGFGGGGNSETDGGGGGGGGGTSVGRPVAVIRVGAGGIEVEPVIDLTKLAVTVLLSGLGVWRALR